ncbi:MAG: type VI secretion system tube protein Hcp [Deltaproteobacteria bacterium]|nr:type VI secretion system tube protein Hcp [Deltaproteobacteria bacterium]
MKRHACFLVALFVVGLFGLTLATEVEAQSIYVWIDGIPGESRDKDHANWIDAESISHQVEQKGSGGVATGGGATSERADFGDFLVFKKIDKATPALNLYCAKGEHIREVRIHLTASTTDAGRVTYMEYKLEDVTVTLVRAEVTGGKVTEEVGLNFGKITWTYTGIAPSGKEAGEIATSWSLAANKEEPVGQKSPPKPSGQAKPLYKPRLDRKIPPNRSFRLNN